MLCDKNSSIGLKDREICINYHRANCFALVDERFKEEDVTLKLFICDVNSFWIKRLHKLARQRFLT